MNSDYKSLHYADETDRCYGLAGMAISLMVWDAEEMLLEIDLDAPAEEALRLTPDFYLTLAPKTGAKAAWEAAVGHFQLISALTVANVTCRHIVRHGRSMISTALDADIRRFLSEEGAEIAQLDDDEVSSIYGKILAHCARIFRHPGVAQLANDLTDAIQKNKKLPAADVLEILRPLNRM